MYLARQTVDNQARFIIRESVREGDLYRSRDLVDLGPDPAGWIVYPGGNAYYIDEAVIDRLEVLGVTPSNEELDDMFWPFLDPRIQRALETFRRRETARRAKGGSSRREGMRLKQETHLFDRRRVHYLRFGQMDQGQIGRMPAVLLRWLADKSRDEIEQHFMEMERVLKPHELKAYVYVIFDLSKLFSQGFAKAHPQMLDPEAVDSGFIEELCRLNEDLGFWAGDDSIGSGVLHGYLKRYAIMFFDGAYGPSNILESTLRDFMNRHRHFRFPETVRTVSHKEAENVFGVDAATLRSMGQRELTRLFRSKAHKNHPDVGGEHEGFIKLVEAYQGLMRKKKQGGG